MIGFFLKNLMLHHILLIEMDEVSMAYRKYQLALKKVNQKIKTKLLY